MRTRASSPRLALLSSRRPGSNPLTGLTGIPSQPIDPRYLDSYDEMDRRVGLALFDPTSSRQALQALSAALTLEELPVHAPTGSVAALAS